MHLLLPPCVLLVLGAVHEAQASLLEGAKTFAFNHGRNPGFFLFCGLFLCLINALCVPSPAKSACASSLPLASPSLSSSPAVLLRPASTAPVSTPISPSGVRRPGTLWESLSAWPSREAVDADHRGPILPSPRSSRSPWNASPRFAPFRASPEPPYQPGLRCLGVLISKSNRSSFSPSFLFSRPPSAVAAVPADAPRRPGSSARASTAAWRTRGRASFACLSLRDRNGGIRASSERPAVVARLAYTTPEDSHGEACAVTGRATVLPLSAVVPSHGAGLSRFASSSPLGCRRHPSSLPTASSSSSLCGHFAETGSQGARRLRRSMRRNLTSRLSAVRTREEPQRGAERGDGPRRPQPSLNSPTPGRTARRLASSVETSESEGTEAGEERRTRGGRRRRQDRIADSPLTARSATGDRKMGAKESNKQELLPSDPVGGPAALLKTLARGQRHRAMETGEYMAEERPAVTRATGEKQSQKRRRPGKPAAEADGPTTGDLLPRRPSGEARGLTGREGSARRGSDWHRTGDQKRAAEWPEFVARIGEGVHPRRKRRPGERKHAGKEGDREMGSVHTGPLRDSWRPRRSKEREEQERKEEAREAVSSGPREAERGERRALFGNVLQSDVGFRRRDGGRVETTGGGVEHVAQDRYGAQRRPPAHNRTLSVSSSISTSLVRRSGQPSSSSSGIFVRRGERAREERATLPLGAKRAGSGVPTAQAHAGKRSDRKILACETLAKDASESGRGDFFDEGERERRKDENLLLTLPASAYPPSPLYPGIRLLPQSLRSRSAFQHFSGLVDLTTISPLSPPVASEPSSQLSRGGTDTAMNGPSNGVSGRRSAENARLDATNRKEDEAEEGDEGDRKSEVSPPDVALGIQKEVRVSEKRILDGHERMAGSNSSCNGTESAGVATEVQESSACEEESVTTRDIASESAFDQAAFRAMGVTHPSLLASLEQAGISTPTAIQRLTAKSLLLSQEDRVPPSAGSSAASGHGCAREMVRPAPRLWLLEAFTGSGKTLAFLLPILQQMLENATPFPQRASIPSIEALILAPGRELAAQIYAVCRALIPAVSLPLSQREEGRRGDNEGASSLSSASPCSSELPVLRPCLLVGGANPERQVERLKRQRPNIVIATPGRLLSFLSSPRGRMRRLVNLRLCTSVVLDEVDALLEEKPLLAASVVKTSEETSVLPPTEERVDSVGEEGDCGGKVDRGTGVDFKCGATHRSGEEEKRAKLEKKRRERLERAMRKQLEALLSRWEARKRFEMWKERKAQREEEEHILGRLRQKGHGESEEAAWKAREEEEASWRVLEELKTRDGTKKKVSFAEQEKHFQTERAKYLRDTQERLRRKLEAQLATPIGADRPGTLRDVQAIMRHLAVNWQRRETADGGVRTDKTEVFVEKEDAGRGEATEERKKASGTEPSRQEERSRTPGGEQEETKHRRNRLLDETKVIEASEDAKTISGPGPPLSAPHAVGDGACVGLSPWPPAPSQSSSPAVAFLHTSLQAPSSPSAASPPTPSFSLPSTPSCSCPSPSLSSSGAASSQHPRMLLVSATASRLRTDRVRDLLRLPPDTRVELLRSIALWQDSDQAPLGRPSFAPVLPSSASSSFESLEASEERVRGETQAGASGMPRRGPGGLSDRENLIHLYVEATNDDILRNFQKFLKAEPFEKTLLVFCNKQKTAAWLQRWFAETEPEVESFLLDGWLDKTKRRSLLRRLLAGPSGPSRGSAEGDTGATGSGNDPRDALAGTRSAWITTEMAARGLDFAGVSVVVNFQLPADSTHYLHRAGRAGRAGNPGAVISFCRPGEASIVRRFARELNVAIHPTRIFHGRLWTLASKNERAPRQIGAVAPAAEG